MLPSLATAFHQDSTTVEIWASYFISSAIDLCSPNDSLQYTFSDTPPNGDPNSGVQFFDCYDLANNPITVEIYVKDTDGNYVVGTSLFNIQDNSGNTCIDSFVEITESVFLKPDVPIKDAILNLENEQDDIIYTTYTNDKDEYTIYADPSAKHLLVEYDDGPEADVTILDRIPMQRHLLRLYPFDEYQILASDINGDNRMKVNDLKLIIQMVLGILDKDEYLDPNW